MRASHLNSCHSTLVMRTVGYYKTGTFHHLYRKHYLTNDGTDEKHREGLHHCERVVSTPTLTMVIN